MFADVSILRCFWYPVKFQERLDMIRSFLFDLRGSFRGGFGAHSESKLDGVVDLVLRVETLAMQRVTPNRQWKVDRRNLPSCVGIPWDVRMV